MTNGRTEYIKAQLRLAKEEERKKRGEPPHDDGIELLISAMYIFGLLAVGYFSAWLFFAILGLK